MDLWVVAAATGAGYIAKYWQNLSGEKEDSTESSSIGTIHGQSQSHNSLQQMGDRNQHLRRSAQNPFGRDVSFDRDESEDKFSECDRSGRDLAAPGVTSTSGGYGEGLANLGNSGDYNVLSLARMPPGLYGRESYQGIGDGSDGKREFYDKSSELLPDFLSEETSYIQRSNNRSRPLKSRRPYGYSAKPLNSLESCLTAQLYREHARLEEYVFSSIPSPSTQMVRPLLVTDGSRIISRASSDFKAEMRFAGGEHRTILGASPLPKRSMEFQRRPRQSFGKVRSRRMSSSVTRVSAGPFNSQGSPNGMLLLFLGITIGIISTAVANKKEVDKLNQLLKQSENLVQDLHEELEMKDLLSVKELPNERFNSPETGQHSFFDGTPTIAVTGQRLDASGKCVSNDLDNQKAEYSESMSNIEAELEAELERLELNMNESRLERMSDFVELDPEFVADLVQGELRLDTVNRQPGGSSDSDRDASGTSTNGNDTGNYAVSPRELSLRLHEVIQLRLEARIAELEMALQENHARISSMKFEHSISQRDLYSEVEYSSTQENPSFVDEGNELERPLVINLSGEALDAYNEAYEEIFRMAKTEEETPPDTMYHSDHEKNTHFQGHNDDEFNSHCDIVEERLSGSLARDKSKTWEELTSISRESKESGESDDDDDDDDDDDEIGMLLIKQIVEKARQGSPAVLNAEQMMYSIDDQ